MTKRALAVIAILMILPIVVALYAVEKYKENNQVVAEYCGGLDIIEYDGVKLRRVEGAEEYRFRLGEYLGKVGNALTGAPLYRLLDDETGSYFAIVEGKSRILYTKSGKLVDGVKGEDSIATLLVFDDFLVVEKYVDIIEKITGASGKRVSVDMSKFPVFKYYDLYLAFDSSAIVTEYFGRLIYLAERESWILISPEDLELAVEEYGDEIDETVYLATLISDEEVSDLINSYFEEKNEEAK
ncbi:MAG: hypothetical protein J6S14_09210 [Clostridia bacterium]|nr:hypothetical protein [Clostridia bacterium]